MGLVLLVAVLIVLLRTWAETRPAGAASTLTEMATTAESSRTSLERNWWLRAPAVLVAPRAVFVALRDESEEDEVDRRQEALTALIGLAGIGAVLGTPVARVFLNDPSRSVALIPVWAFLGGAFYAFAAYWVGGGLLFGAARRLGGLGSYRRARSLVALASAPLALALFTLWPVRLAIYGEEYFRTAGDKDWGPGDRIFGGLLYATVAWSALLLLVGVRAVHGWSWARTAATVALAASVPGLLVLATLLH